MQLLLIDGGGVAPLTIDGGGVAPLTIDCAPTNITTLLDLFRIA